jgi:hypothetical protein
VEFQATRLLARPKKREVKLYDRHYYYEWDYDLIVSV